MAGEASSTQTLEADQFGDRPIQSVVVGLSPAGVFHVQSLLLRSGFDFLAAATVCEHERAVLHGVRDCPVRSLDDVSDFPERPDLVVLAASDPRSIDLARQSASRGAFLLAEPSVLQEAEARRMLGQLAGELPGRCGGWRPDRCDGSFRPAMEFVKSGRGGLIRRVSWTRLDLAERLAPHSQRETDAGESNPMRLAGFAASALDQLLCLLDSPVVRLSARISNAIPGFGKTGNRSALETTHETGFCVQLQTESGIVAQLEIDLACSTPLDTGWMIQGTQGGFGQGAESRTEPDGEVYQVPVDVEPIDPYAELEALLRGDRSTLVPGVVSSIQHEVVVAEFLEAIRIAADAGNVIDVSIGSSECDC